MMKSVGSVAIVEIASEGTTHVDDGVVPDSATALAANVPAVFQVDDGLVPTSATGAIVSWSVGIVHVDDAAVPASGLES